MTHLTYEIMKTRCPPGYHHNGFMATCVLEIHKVLFRAISYPLWLKPGMHIVFKISCKTLTFLSKTGILCEMTHLLQILYCVAAKIHK